MVNRGSVAFSALPEDVVPVGALGGDVLVVSMPLSLRLALSAKRGGTVAQHSPAVLHACVLDADRQPIFTAEQWEAWGAQHFAEAVALFTRVLELSDILAGGEEAAKND